MGVLAGAVEGEKGDGSRRHLNQTKDHLGQIDVHPEVGNIERQAVVDKDVDEPAARVEAKEREFTALCSEITSISKLSPHVNSRIK